MSYNKQQKRATFEDVCKAQEILIGIIDKCIENNSILDDKQRKIYLNSYRLATLGLGSEFNFFIKGKNKTYNLNHVGHAVYWLAYRTSNKIKMGDEIIDICDFWLKLRDMLFIIFDYAVETAIKISKEQVRLGISKAAEV